MDEPEATPSLRGGVRSEGEVPWTEARDFLSRRLRRELRGQGPDDLQDLTQEALVRLLRAVRREGAENTEALMTAIARRTAIDHIRRTMRWSRRLEYQADPCQQAASAGVDGPDDELDRLRFVALEFFAARGRPCHDLALAFFACRDWRRVAEDLGRSHEAVRRQWSRCVEALRAEAVRNPGLVTEWISDR
jgi:RNA polymerase sigma factor (sigma-70 family)